MALVEPAPDELGVVEVVLDEQDPERSALAAFAFCHDCMSYHPEASA